MPGDLGSLVVDADGGQAAAGVCQRQPIRRHNLGLRAGNGYGTARAGHSLLGSAQRAYPALVFRRLADRWALAQEVAGAGGRSNALVEEQLKTMNASAMRILEARWKAPAGMPWKPPCAGWRRRSPAQSPTTKTQPACSSVPSASCCAAHGLRHPGAPFQLVGAVGNAARLPVPAAARSRGSRPGSGG